MTDEQQICGICDEHLSLDDYQCPHSLRECGHHCTHVWTQDECCWCGAEYGEENDPDNGIPKW